MGFMSKENPNTQNMSVGDFQKMIMDEINESDNKIFLQVQKKTLNKNEFLNSIRNRAKEAKLTDEQIEDVLLLVTKTLWGFGPLDYYINEDPTISDIRLISKDEVRAKRNGVRETLNVKFSSDNEYDRYIELIAGRNSVNLSVSNAVQVFTDKDSSPTNILRFSLVSDLLNTNGHSTLLIRKIPKKKKTFDTLLGENFLAEEQRDYLTNRWQTGHSILVCGPNGSGKTTLTNAILDVTPHDKSGVVIQESEELFCDSHPETIFRKILPTRNNNKENSFYYDLKSLGALALMESFDIIVIGEIKGREAASLAYATYTGSQAMTTVHSISAKDGLDKIIDYALDDQPNRTREHFAKQFQTLDTIVYVEDYHISQIVELKGYDAKTGEYDFNEVF